MSARMQLLGFERIGKGALLGRAKVRLPNQLEIDGIDVFQKAERRWAQMPSEVMRDRNGYPLKDEHRKSRYRLPLRWETRDLRDRFSEALIALIEVQHGPIGGAR
jgi:hypothetical protein